MIHDRGPSCTAVAGLLAYFTRELRLEFHFITNSLIENGGMSDPKLPEFVYVYCYHRGIGAEGLGCFCQTVGEIVPGGHTRKVEKHFRQAIG